MSQAERLGEASGGVDRPCGLCYEGSRAEPGSGKTDGGEISIESLQNSGKQ